MAKKQKADIAAEAESIRQMKTQAAKMLGRLGGLARAKNLTKEELHESARKAIRARWKKYRKMKGK